MSYAATNTQEDEVVKWDFFLGTFPLSSKQIVFSRYLAFGLLVLGSTIFMLLMSIISYTIFEDHSLGLYLIFLCVGFILSLISLSILIPVNFYSGSKGSITIMIGAGFLLSAFPALAEAGIIDLFAWEITREIFAVLLIIFTIVLAIASVGISIFIYSRKKF